MTSDPNPAINSRVDDVKGQEKPPRIQAYLEHAQGRSAFASPRSQWDSLLIDSTQAVTIDVTNTPIGAVAHEASLIAAVANRTSTGGGRVTVYRLDPKDQHTPVNVDHYSVWTDIASHPQIEEFVSAASTDLNPNLRQYLTENVLWVKEEPGADHWLSVVPSSVVTAIRIGEAPKPD